MAFKFLLVLVLAALATGQNKLMYNMDQKSPYVVGDIRLVDWQLEETKGAVVNYPAMYWPGGKIPYNMSAAFSLVIQEAIAYYNMNTCIQFVPWTPKDKNYVQIIKGVGCYSHLGMVEGKQSLSLGDGCFYKGIILNALGHTIGLLHEHTRHDRDEYVEMHWDNMPYGWDDQYQKELKRDERICNKTYDCNSIMHFGPDSPDGEPVLSAKFPNCTLKDFATRDRLSELDFLAIACAYCPDKMSHSFKN